MPVIDYQLNDHLALVPKTQIALGSNPAARIDLPLIGSPDSARSTVPGMGNQNNIVAIFSTNGAG
jgi:hypothetical protein